MLPALSTSRFERMPPNPFATLRHELDDLFGRFVGGTDSGSLLPGAWYAPVALWEDNEHVYLEIEVPGVGGDALEVVVHHGNLRVSGERKMPEGDRQYCYNERRYGGFERFISLPEAVDPDSIRAELRDGILHVTLTKRPEAGRSGSR